MKYVDEFRDQRTVSLLLQQIRRKVTRQWSIMEICGGQTHALLRYGFDEELAGKIELMHGPGCPVCVTNAELIDQAIEMSLVPNVLVTTFGDMMRVPGSHASLLAARARGANVQTVYSPLDAVKLAEQQPGKRVIFFAVGFETTAPATALAVLQAAQLGLSNFGLLVAHVRVEPAMEMLLADSQRHIDGFLAAGHVCTVTGTRAYQAMVDKYSVPIIVAGFEPVDLAVGLLACVDQLENGLHQVENCYQRSVNANGNCNARRIIDEVFEPVDRSWRGFGNVRQGGLRIKKRWQTYDAELQIPICTIATSCGSVCRSGEVLAGRLKPSQCEQYATACTPERPLGAPMVSSEGACAAYFLAGRTSDLR